MKKGIAKFTAFCLVMGFSFTQSGAVCLSAGIDTALVGVNSSTKSRSSAESKTASLESDAAKSGETDAPATGARTEAASKTSSDAGTSEDYDDTESEDGYTYSTDSDDSYDSYDDGSWYETDDSSYSFSTTGFAKCSSYVNIRSSADTSGEVIGLIYNNGAVEILDTDENGWYHIVSGDVEGYVASQFIATGSEAQQIASTAGYTTAEVGAEYLNVRSDASEDAPVISVVQQASQMEVVQDEGEWVKVALDDGTIGYVSSDYVYTTTEYATAVDVSSLYDYSEPASSSSADTVIYDDSFTDHAYAAFPHPAPVYYPEQPQEIYDTWGTDDSLGYTADPSMNDISYGYTQDPSWSDYSYVAGYDTADSYGYTAAEDSQATTWITDNTVTGSAARLQAEADAAYQVYLEAQAEADAATGTSDTENVYATAAAAEQAFLNYAAARNAADAALVAEWNAAHGVDNTQVAADGSGADQVYYQTGSEWTPSAQENTAWTAVPDASVSSDASVAAADAAYQVYLEAQARADASVSSPDPDVVYAAAAEAEKAFNEYITARNAADQALVAEWQENFNQQNTAAAATGNSYPAETASYTNTVSLQQQASTASAASDSAQAVADAAYQVYLDAQAKADASVSSIDPNVVYAAADEARKAYAAFVEAQTAADEAAVAAMQAEYLAQNSTEPVANTVTNTVTNTAAPSSTTPSEPETDAPVRQTEAPVSAPDNDYSDPAGTTTYTPAETPSTASSLGQQIVDYAVQFVGNPYVWGGTSLTNGADCSGFTLSVMAHFGISLPHYAASQAELGTPVSLDELQPGDLLFYTDSTGIIGHVSIYMGNGSVVHASSSTTGIIISSLSYRSVTCARRYV